MPHRLLTAINIHFSYGPARFFLEGVAWPLWNRMFQCGEQRKPVSASEERKLLGRRQTATSQMVRPEQAGWL